MAQRSELTSRRKTAQESFKTAAETIGTIEPGHALFAITRGQFSMIDAILVCLDQSGPAAISVWTWTIAEYEIECFERLRIDKRITAGTMVIDKSARTKNMGLIAQWKSTFGPDSVRYVVNHAKIATVQSEKFKILLRGSMNLNFNPRFEQFDLTEGCQGFDLVKRIESELPILADNASGKEIYAASKLTDAWSESDLEIFQGIKIWNK